MNVCLNGGQQPREAVNNGCPFIPFKSQTTAAAAAAAIYLILAAHDNKTTTTTTSNSSDIRYRHQLIYYRVLLNKDAIEAQV